MWRLLGSSSSIISMDRTLGHPVMDPPGNVALIRSTESFFLSRTPSTTDTRWCTFLYTATFLCSETRTDPPVHTFPISFRKRSTIMESSASSFRLVRRSAFSLSSSVTVFPLGLVPLMGLVSTRSPDLRINRSGEVDTIS